MTFFLSLRTKNLKPPTNRGERRRVTRNEGTAAPVSSCPCQTVVETATRIVKVPWTAGILSDVAATATVHDVAYAPDGGVFVVGEFTGAADIQESSGVSIPPITSDGVGTSDGFFAKLDKNGELRHIVQLRGAKPNALTGVQ